ncbi:glycosyltransferase family 2 protein [Allochromatium humboldtianum]|uniref:Glycosyltransferase family 2 protein n=1 Tax=Allochromatium humboldtianum TaxID=504901 RepID=A0A850R2Q8_9GAMM|nr:glycosyltransferase family 2 protein [Allochromatium humboldtianum]NVZ07648.1 glycosyltransferase family 2 protein [Allochromatium humboldtianum]
MSQLTLVIPVFNEGAPLTDNVRAIREAVARIPEHRFQFLLVDDGSTDDSFIHLSAIRDTYADVSVLRLTRNFGKEAAIQAGLEHVDEASDAVIVMDADMQHPPALIPGMVALWNSGIDVVEAEKIRRQSESAISRWMAEVFYRIFFLLTGMDIRNQSDFKLLDRRVLDFYRNLHERERFFRGMIHWGGFPLARLTFEVSPRRHGNSRWSRFKLWRYSISAITSFSSAPLHFITILGALTFVVSIIFSAKALYDKFSGVALGGFTTVILLQLFIGSTLMISLGLLGIYVARIHDEVKRRPSYIVDWRVNSQKSASDENKRAQQDEVDDRHQQDLEQKG